MPSSSTLIPHSTIAGVGKARRTGHPREHGLHVLLDILAPIAVRPGRDPLGRGGIGDLQAANAGSASAATACVSPVITTTACWMSQPRADELIEQRNVDLERTDLDAAVDPIDGARTQRPAQARRRTRSRSSGRAGVSAWLERPRPGSPGVARRTQPSSVRSTRVGGPGANAVAPRSRATSSSPGAGASSPVTPAHAVGLRLQHRVEQAGEALLELVGAQPVEPALAVDPLGDDTRLTEHAEVMRAGGLRDREVEAAAGVLAARRRAATTIRRRTGSLSAWRIVARSQVVERSRERAGRPRASSSARLDHDATAASSTSGGRSRRSHRLGRRSRSICKRRHAGSIVREASNGVL